MKDYNFARHGIPAILLSEEGSEFLNRLVTETCKLCGVTKVFSAAYHSRGHGKVERLNRTMEDRLKHTTNFSCNDWDQWLPKALFAIHTTPSVGTKFSPFRLLYGRDAIMPIDNALMDPLATQNIDQLENR
jgi:transposase InsO family protein